MKIKTKLTINSLLIIGNAIVIICIVAFPIRYNFEKIQSKAEIVQKIQHSASLLNALTYEYMLNHEERVITQWTLKNKILEECLKHYKQQYSTEHKIEIDFIDDMIKNHQNINEYFSKIVEMTSTNPPVNYNTIYFNRLQFSSLFNAQYLINNAFELLKHIQNEQSEVIVNGFFWTLSCFIGCFCIIFTISFFINRRILKSLLSLNDGVVSVGNGNLDYQFDTTSKDEMGTLARAFNEMTQKLHRSYAELNTEINERKKIEQHLKEKNEELYRSNKELEDFAYIASHDLQEPLRKIQSFSDLLKDEESETLTESGKDYVDRMQKSAIRMSQLIEDLLSFSRITTKAKPPQQIDLNTILQEVVSVLEKRIQDTSAKITVQSLPIIEAEPSQMKQLFQNLIANAIKFHKQGISPVISIEYSKIDEKTCQILVTDNGIGFEEKYVDRIFQPFERLHGKGVYEGTGIGLAVCKKIVDRHFGKITATSALGNGATFTVLLPIHQVKQERSN